MRIHGGTLDFNLTDFSANTSPLGMHDSSKESLHKIALNPNYLCIYPDSSCSKLRSALGKFWKFDSDKIVCGNGSADLIYEIAKIYNEFSAIILSPAFSEYENAIKSSNPTQKIIKIQKEDLEAEVNLLSNCSLFFAASPSNPTGEILSFDEIVKIEEFCEKNNGIFVLDSCFSQFSKNAELILRKIIEQKSRFKNLIVLNAFTKFYGMAGLRLGYALCFGKKTEILQKRMRPWTVNSVAQICGISVMESESSNSTWTEKMRTFIESEKKRFYNFFDETKIEYKKSEANFILCKLNFDNLKNAKIQNDDCITYISTENERIAIRNCSDFYNLDSTWFRIAIKSQSENTKLLNLLKNSQKIESKRKAKPIMIQGTMSNAGKSLLVAALCRIFSNDGFKVAPFKSQNMALNSGVTFDGKEMGRAQILQAQASRILPDVRMNPILLKPNSDTGSQIILNGMPICNMSAKDYFKFRKNLVPQILESYNSLASENDIIVIEGAGSPAEINLKKDDIVNMGLAELVDSPVLIAGDIDRGGVFASLYGTSALVTENERNRIKGFLINKFRGDVKLLENGLEMLENLTKIPVLGVVPYIKKLQLDDEDSLSEKLENPFLKKSTFENALSIFVVKLPYLSNFTDLNVFSNLDFVNLFYFDSLEEYNLLEKKYGKPDLIILPGTKNTILAMEFLNEKNLSELIKEFAKENPVIGICGGYQILGEELFDEDGNESGNKKILKALGLLPTKTIFTNQKKLVQVSKNLPEIEGFYSALSHKKVEGYEIHSGKTISIKNESECLFSVNNFVFGTYVHGFFDSSEIFHSVIKILCERRNMELPNFEDYLNIQEKEFERLEKVVRESVNMEEIYKIIGIKK